MRAVLNILGPVLGVLPALGVLFAVKTMLCITIIMVGVAIWPFIPRITRRKARVR
jgi:hypothetical protein